MNKLNNLLLGTAMLTLFSATASANNNIIQFSGQVSPVTCTVTVDGQVGNRSILLPTVGVDEFKADSGTGSAVSKTAAPRNFTIELTGCPVDTTKERTFKAVMIPNQGYTTSGNLANVATVKKANNVEFQLLDPRKDAINFSVSTNNEYRGEDFTLKASENSASAIYTVQYISTGTNITAGNIRSSVQYAIDYM